MPTPRCSVRLTRRYNAPPEEVWLALTESDSLRRWLASPVEGELSAGASFEVGSGGSDSATATVRNLEQGRVLELDWEIGGDVSTVRLELASDGGSGTVLLLDHRLIDERSGMRQMRLWTDALARLERDLGS